MRVDKSVVVWLGSEAVPAVQGRFWAEVLEAIGIRVATHTLATLALSLGRAHDRRSGFRARLSCCPGPLRSLGPGAVSALGLGSSASAYVASLQGATHDGHYDVGAGLA